MIVTVTRLRRRSMLNFTREFDHEEMHRTTEQIAVYLTEPEGRPILSFEQYARFMRSLLFPGRGSDVVEAVCTSLM